MVDKNIILGAGVAGLGAAHALDYQCTIYEAQDTPGGLCGYFTKGEFRFDKAVHLSFAKDERVVRITRQTPHYTYHPYPDNWYKKRWIKHPVQNNLAALDIEDRVQALLSYFSRSKKLREDSFEAWCLSRYGQWIFDNIIAIYNKKYWCCDLQKLGTAWIKNRLYQTSEKEILEGAFLEQTPNTYYAQEMIYPRQGGYIHLWDSCLKRSRIHTRHRAVAIDPVQKTIRFANGVKVAYEQLYCSIPLPELVRILTIDVNSAVKNAAERLAWTSMALVSVGFRTTIPFPDIWFYIYDTTIGAARAYSPSAKSPANAPEGKSSLQFEFYFYKDETPDRERILRETQSFLKQQGWLEYAEFFDVHTEPYANVIMTRERERERERDNPGLSQYFFHLSHRTFWRMGLFMERSSLFIRDEYYKKYL